MDVGPSKPTAVYYAQDHHKARHLKWPVPMGGPKSFYTTWNAAGSILITCLVLLCIPWMRIWPTTQKIAAFTVVPLAIAAMASIVCTTIVSQLMLAFNVRIDRSDDEPEEHRGKRLALGVHFVQKMLCYNFIWHLSILVLAVVLGLAITFMPSPSTLLGRGAVFLVSFLYFATFVLAWLLTPVEIQHEEGKPTVTVMGWDKIKYVYRDPSAHYFTVVFPLVALLVLLVGNFALYGALNSHGMRGF
jgi:hypothetical protein